MVTCFLSLITPLPALVRRRVKEPPGRQGLLSVRAPEIIPNSATTGQELVILEPQPCVGRFLPHHLDGNSQELLGWHPFMPYSPFPEPLGWSLCPPLLGFSRALRLASHTYFPHMPPGSLASDVGSPRTTRPPGARAADSCPQLPTTAHSLTRPFFRSSTPLPRH